MFIALSINSSDFAQGSSIEELLENAKAHLSDVSVWEDLAENYDIHEIGRPLIVKRFVNFSVTRPE